VDLVTGGCGFVGSHVTRALREAGHAVRVLDLADPDPGADFEPDRGRDAGPSTASGHGGTAATPFAGVEHVRGDILDEAVLRSSMEGCRRVFHLAADPNLWHPDPAHFERVNHGGTEAVLRAARDVGVARVIHTSTEAVLLPRRGDGPHDEQVRVTERDMAGPYARSKLRAERAALRYAASGEVDVVVVNLSAPVGPGDRGPTPPTRMIVDFLEGRIPAYVEARLAFVDVRDAALGHVLAAQRGVSGRRHILTAPSVTLGEFFEMLGRVAGRSPPRLRLPYPIAWSAAVVDEFLSRLRGTPPRAPLEGVRMSRRPMRFDDSWTRETLGFRTRPLEDSLRDAVAWLSARTR